MWKSYGNISPDFRMLKEEQTNNIWFLVHLLFPVGINTYLVEPMVTYKPLFQIKKIDELVIGGLIQRRK